MKEVQIRTLEQVRQVLAGTKELQFCAASNDGARYEWLESVLRRFNYRQLSRRDRGLVLEYLRRFSGYSRAQVTRLVTQWRKEKRLTKRYVRPAHAFTGRFLASDAVLLADVDRAMDTLSGIATTKVLQRQFEIYGDARFERLATISSAHVYNLRASKGYQAERVVTSKTRPSKAITIGQRRAPAPDGRAGFIRIDSVHQGDQDGIKGLYHINAVDCVTQWQVVASVQAISEAFLLPVIEQMLAQFPFQILGFHADNGSEYVNYRVAEMLEKLRVEFTRSRPRHSNDNGLAETKNGVVVRKVFGYGHIPQAHAERFNRFCVAHLNPYLNLHRPCLFATDVADPKKPGRIKKVYRAKDVMTPLEKLASLPNASQYLKPGIRLADLLADSKRQTDLQAGQALQAARAVIFKSVHRRVA